MKNKLSHKRIIAILFALALTLQMAAPSFVWDNSFAEEVPKQELPKQELPKQELPKQELPKQELPEECADEQGGSAEEELPWDDKVVVEGMTIKAKAEKGALPKTAKLKVTGMAENDAANIMTVLEGIRGEERAQIATHIYDVAITDSDSKELKPADNMKVKITFESNEFSAEGADVRMYVALGSDVKEVDPSKVEIETETTIVVDITKAAEISKAKEEENTDTEEKEKIKDSEEEKEKEEKQKDIAKEDAGSDTEVEKASKKDSAPRLRTSPSTGLFVGTNIAMILIIAVAVIAGGILTILSFRPR